MKITTWLRKESITKSCTNPIIKVASKTCVALLRPVCFRIIAANIYLTNDDARMPPSFPLWCAKEKERE